MADGGRLYGCDCATAIWHLWCAVATLGTASNADHLTTLFKQNSESPLRLMVMQQGKKRHAVLENCPCLTMVVN